VSDEALVARWAARFAQPTSGWDFSHLTGRHEDEPPWSYDELARTALAGASSVLDLGTGGGEVLGRLADALPRETTATEGWPPNLPVAREALAPLGIEVVPYDVEQDPSLPFDGERFDAVLDRHEAYVATEVHRVLRPGGRFVTQQVDGRSFAEMQALFGGTTAHAHITLSHLRDEAREAGFEVVEVRDWTGAVRFDDVETLVGYVAMVPWEVPDDFSVARHAQRLLDLHHSGRPLEFPQRRFVLFCRKPALAG